MAWLHSRILTPRVGARGRHECFPYINIVNASLLIHRASLISGYAGQRVEHATKKDPNAVLTQDALTYELFATTIYFNEKGRGRAP